MSFIKALCIMLFHFVSYVVASLGYFAAIFQFYVFVAYSDKVELIYLAMTGSPVQPYMVLLWVASILFCILGATFMMRSILSSSDKSMDNLFGTRRTSDVKF